MSIFVNAGSEMPSSCDNNASESKCYLRAAISLLEGKYTLFILKQFFSGNQRFSNLLRTIPGISRKTLSDKLRNLTEIGLLSRTAYAEVPPRVEYELTPYGQSLREVVSKLELLGKEMDKPPVPDVTPAKVPAVLEARESAVRVYRCGVSEDAAPRRSLRG